MPEPRQAATLLSLSGEGGEPVGSNDPLDMPVVSGVRQLVAERYLRSNLSAALPFPSGARNRSPGPWIGT